MSTALVTTNGIDITESSFRRARAFLALRDGIIDPPSSSTYPRREGVIAQHRNGSEIMIDAHPHLVKSNTKFPIKNENPSGSEENTDHLLSSEMVYALWITYSRNSPTSRLRSDQYSHKNKRPPTIRHPTSSGQSEIVNPMTIEPQEEDRNTSLVAPNVVVQSQKPVVKCSPDPISDDLISETANDNRTSLEMSNPVPKKSINDFIILEEMGKGAYGQVKLARYKKDSNRKTVLKYVTKRRILIDTWARDRRLGTVPLEIHVLNYLRQDGLQHPNIIEMVDFFEDDINYYIETAPHGLPGMDLFDYIELRTNMGEAECRSIFVQVAQAVYHLHIKACVVHRDIKDENVVLDGEGKIKLIDFGSAAYIKNGPFDVFVGTIDYAAPEVLAGKPYRGKEQDVWALGILLYTIVYKENPFYSNDEIMCHDLRVPYVMNEGNLNLIRSMLDRDIESRFTIEEVLEHPWCRAIDNV